MASARDRIRLLFVTNQFFQGGAERYLYEICCALDRTAFDVQILTRSDVDRTGHYYPRLVELGIPIHAIRPHVPDIQRFAPSIASWRSYRVGRHHASAWLARRRVKPLLDSFDVVACIQLENYLALQGAIGDHPGAVTHLLSNRFQYAYDPYDEVDTRRLHRWVTCDRSQEEEIRSVENVETFRWPMSLQLRGYPLVRLPAPERPLKIGIVTRLSREKPIAPLLRAFSELRSDVDATLHIYGGGSPALFDDDIRALGIGDHVRFEGHRRELVGMLESDGLSMCWLMSVGSLVGYASLEIAAAGIPMVFWNYGSAETAGADIIRRETNGAINAFHSVAEFVDFARRCLTDRARLEGLGRTLRDYVFDRHDIDRTIASLEAYYRGITETAGFVSRHAGPAAAQHQLSGAAAPAVDHRDANTVRPVSHTPEP